MIVICNAYMIYEIFRNVGLQLLRNQNNLPMDKYVKYLNSNCDLLSCDAVYICRKVPTF
jgi:hypothetical protein